MAAVIIFTSTSSGGGGSGSGWTETGAVVHLTTVTNQVGIGTASPAADEKLNVTGDGTFKKITVVGGAATASSGAAGGAVSITGGAGDGAGAGGAATLTGGAGGTGGAVTITGGSSNTTGIAGGSVSLSSGGNFGITTGVATLSISGSTYTSGIDRNGGGISLVGGLGAVGGSGGSVTVISGGGGASGAGGGLTLIAGMGGSGANAGAVTITGGAAYSGGGSATPGGAVTITGGVGKGTGAGGAVSLTGGDGSTLGVGSGTGGAASVTGGAGGVAGNSTGGAASLTGGAGTTFGGGASVTGGPGGTTGAGGAVSITSGDGGSTSGNSGNVSIDSGAVVSGTAGTVDLGLTNASAVRICSAGGSLSFHGVAAVAQQTVSGSRGDNAALADLLTKLANLGLIVDGTIAGVAAALGPSSSVDSYVSVFSGTTGKLLDDRPVTFSSTGQQSWPTGLGPIEHISGPSDQTLRINTQADTMQFRVGGATRISVTSTIIPTVPINGADGSASAPAFSFTNDPNTGLYSYGADQIGMATAGTLRMRVTSSAVVAEGVPVEVPAGSAAAPQVRFSGDSDTGFYNYAANIPGASYGGVGAAIPGVLHKSVTSASTTAVTTEETLWSYSLPAGTLASDGQAVRIKAWGKTAANGNSKVIRAYFGASTFNSFTTTTSGETWEIEALVARTGAATQSITGTRKRSTAGVAYASSTDNETLSGTVTISITGQNGTANAGDIVFSGAIVEFLP